MVLHIFFHLNPCDPFFVRAYWQSNVGRKRQIISSSVDCCVINDRIEAFSLLNLQLPIYSYASVRILVVIFKLSASRPRINNFRRWKISSASEIRAFLLLNRVLSFFLYLSTTVDDRPWRRSLALTPLLRLNPSTKKKGASPASSVSF